MLAIFFALGDSTCNSMHPIGRRQLLLMWGPKIAIASRTVYYSLNNGLVRHQKQQGALGNG